MSEHELAERFSDIFRRVNSDDRFKQPMCDEPADRILATEVSSIIELLEGLTLHDVHKIVQHAMCRNALSL